MIIDVQALFSVVIGLLCATLYVLWNKKHLIYLVSALQLITDKRYRNRLIDTINTQNFVLNAGYRYHLMPLDEHIAAFAASKHTMQTGITSEYIVILKSMIFQLIRISLLPFIVSVLLREPFVFVGALVMGIPILVLYLLFFAHGKNYMRSLQIALLLRHAYSHTTHTTAQLGINSMNETDQQGTIHVSESDPNAELQSEDGYRKEYETYNSIDTYLAKQQQLTWQRVWWINDALLCTLLIVLYWFTIDNSFDESLYGSIQIILFVQIFFVPVWFVISIARKHLSNHST